MSAMTLMVHLELGHPNAALLQVTADLASRLDAGVIGIVACQPMQAIYSEGYIPADLIERDAAELEAEMKKAEAEFRAALQSRVPLLRWRSAAICPSLSAYVADEARSADLVLTGVTTGALFDPSWSMNTGDLIMQVGRPVLVVPLGVDKLSLQRMLIGWRDTREARRAIMDALPLLKHADQVTVVEIAPAEELAATRLHIDDVVNWLKGHGVAAAALAAAASGEDADQLSAIAHEYRADVIVAGAYGHSRLREWVMGGVSRDLLLSADICSLVSH